MRLMNYAIFPNLTVSDPFWVQLRQEAKALAEREGAMSKLLQQGVLQHATFNEALANRLALKLANDDIDATSLRNVVEQTLQRAPDIVDAALADMREQVGHLVYPGFIARTPWDWLRHVARYLTGVEKRLGKLSSGVERDAKLQGLVRPLWEAFLARVAAGSPVDEALVRILGEVTALDGDATMLFAVPTMYHRLAAEAEQDSEICRALGGARLLVSGSAALPAVEHERIERLTGQRIAERYGMTETLMNTGVRASGERRPGYVGPPLKDVEIRLVDDDGRDVGPGEEGEVVSRGPDQFLGYMDPAMDAEAFDDDGWFRTGDIGRLDADGYLTITDRKKDIIIRGGENISAREVEEVLATHPKVQESAVTSVPDERYGERVCASDAYWRARLNCRYGVIIWLAPLRPAPPGVRILRQYGTAWVMLGESRPAVVAGAGAGPRLAAARPGRGPGRGGGADGRDRRRRSYPAGSSRDARSRSRRASPCAPPAARCSPSAAPRRNRRSWA